MPVSELYSNELLDELYGSGTPATLYFALFTSAPSPDGTGGTEVTGGSYARKAVTNNNTEFPDAVTGEKTNANAITWASATADWGIVTHLKVVDTVSGAPTNIYDWGELTDARDVLNGDTFSIAPTQFVVQM